MMSAKPLLNPPDVFSRMFLLLHQDAFEIYPTIETWIEDHVEDLSAGARTTLKTYLDRVLDGSFTNAQLRGLLQRTEAAWFTDTKGARHVLEEIRRRL